MFLFLYSVFVHLFDVLHFFIGNNIETDKKEKHEEGGRNGVYPIGNELMQEKCCKESKGICPSALW